MPAPTPISFPTFVAKYEPVSPSRKEAMKVLRKIKADLPDLPSWKQVKALLPPADFKAHWLALHSLHTLWRQQYSQGRTTVVQPLTRVSEPAPMPKGALKISTRINPVEFEIDGSLVLVPLGAIAWVKAIDETSCIVGLLNGETLDVTNTPTEIRQQLHESPGAH